MLGEAPSDSLASSFLCAFAVNACIGSLKTANCCYCQAGGCSHCWVFNISEERSYQIPRARPLPCSHHDCRSPSALHRSTVLRSIPIWEDPSMVRKTPFSKGNRSLEQMSARTRYLVRNGAPIPCTTPPSHRSRPRREVLARTRTKPATTYLC